jgi:hypothetical protein
MTIALFPTTIVLAVHLYPNISGICCPSLHSKVINGTKYTRIHMHYIYSHTIDKCPLSLIDRGANGGLAGDDVLSLELSLRTVTISGIDGHTLTDIPIGTVAGLVDSSNGRVSGVYRQQ